MVNPRNKDLDEFLNDENVSENVLKSQFYPIFRPRVDFMTEIVGKPH